MKPDFYRHELLQDLDVTYTANRPMMVFSGLWGHCDKAGRFLWQPKQLKLDILPFIQFDMAETLEILEQAHLVVRYRVGATEYGWIPSFTDHQRISGKESQEPEKFPGPPSEVIVKFQGSVGEAHGNVTGLQEGKGRELGRERERSKALASLALPDWIPQEPWDGWLEVRSRNRAPNTARALKLAITELAKLKAGGQDVKAVLEQSTLRGWRGVFPVKQAQGTPPNYEALQRRLEEEEALKRAAH